MQENANLANECGYTGFLEGPSKVFANVGKNNQTLHLFASERIFKIGCDTDTVKGIIWTEIGRKIINVVFLMHKS